MKGAIILYIITALLICATGVFMLIREKSKSFKVYAEMVAGSAIWLLILVGAVIFGGIRTFTKNDELAEFTAELEKKVNEKLEQEENGSN